MRIPLRGRARNEDRILTVKCAPCSAVPARAEFFLPMINTLKR